MGKEERNVSRIGMLATTFLCLLAVIPQAVFGQESNAPKFETEEISVFRDSLRLSGELLRPTGKASQLPLVVLSHGFGASREVCRPYAEALAGDGYLCCIFDFAGGGNASRSDGRTRDMSVFTERADLLSMLGALRRRTDVDTSLVFLFGESQGGLVSAMAAAERPQDVTRLVLLYPAFSIPTDAIQRFPRPEDMPETYNVWGMELGRVYGAGFYGYDVWKDVSRYNGPVLILHGNRDTVVPVRYGLQAAATYADAEFHTIPGAGHGYGDADREKVLNYIRTFLHSADKE